MIVSRDTDAEEAMQAFTFEVADETMAVPVASVQTVFRIDAITRVPLAAPEMVGLVNLRGAIVPAMSLRRRLGLSERGEQVVGSLAIGVAHGNETIALLVDAVGDVVTLAKASRASSLAHLPPERVALTLALYRHRDAVLPILDLDALVTLFPLPARAA